MSQPDDDFDPDDNFGHSFAGGAQLETDDEATPEMLVWQLLLLINPGDEALAMQQLDAWREATAIAPHDDTGEAPERQLIDIIKDVIDWRSGYHVDWQDPGALVDAIDELTARWNLRIDWGVEDPTDAEYLAGTDLPELMATAYDRLREYGYTLWTWNTEGDAHAGWITLSTDDESMRVIAPALGIEVRAANEAF